MIHAHFEYDNNGDLVDIQWFCNKSCYNEAGHNGVGGYPCGNETDYNVYCDNCNDLLWKGLNNDY